MLGEPMKKLIFTMGLIIISLSLTTCETVQTIIQQPIVSFHSVKLENINLNGIQLLNFIQIQNPNGFDIPFPEVGWEFFINANSFVSGVIRNSQRVRARDITLVEVPVNLDYLEIFNTFSSLKGRSQSDYKIALAAKFNIPVIGDKVWRFEHNGNFPVLQVPRLSTPSMAMNRADLTMAEFVVTINVENPNPFPLPSPKIAFDYKLNNTTILRNNYDNRSPLSSSSVSPLRFGIAVYYADVLRVLPGLRGNTTSQLDMNFDFGIPAFANDIFNLQVPGILPMPGF